MSGLTDLFKLGWISKAAYKTGSSEDFCYETASR